MIPLERRERALRTPISRTAAGVALAVTFGILLAGGCFPWGVL